MSSSTRYLGLDFSQYRWIVLSSVFLVNFTIVGIAWYYPLMLVDVLLEDLSTDLSGWGLLWGAISLGALLSSFPAGVLADWWGVRRVVASALLLGAGALILRAEFAGFASALVSMLLFGVTAGVLVVVLPKTLGLWFGREKLGFANGFAQAGVGVSFTVTGFATIPMVEFFGGWREFSFAFGWLALGLSVLWWLLIRDPERSLDDSSEPSVLSGLRLTLRVRDVWLMALCYLLYSAGYFGASGFIPVFFG